MLTSSSVPPALSPLSNSLPLSLSLPLLLPLFIYPSLFIYLSLSLSLLLSLSLSLLLLLVLTHFQSNSFIPVDTTHLSSLNLSNPKPSSGTRYYELRMD